MSEITGHTFELNISGDYSGDYNSYIENLLKYNKLLHLRLIILASGRLKAEAIFENFDGLPTKQKINAEMGLELMKRTTDVIIASATRKER